MYQIKDNDVFFFNRLLLQCAGLWRPKTQTKLLQISYKIYSIVIFLFVNVFFTTTEFISLFYAYGNLYDLIKNINFALTHLMGAIKVVFWYYKGHVLRELMEILESDEYLYENCDNFQPGRVLKSYKNSGLRYTFSFYILAHLTLSSSYLPPLISTIFHPNYVMKHQNGNTTRELFEQKLPYYSWMPFSYNTPSTYLLALGYQAGPMFSYAYSIVGMDSLFMNIMNFIAAHFVVLQGAFQTVRKRCLRRVNNRFLTPKRRSHNSGELMKIMKEEMKKICRHLQIILKVCEDLENVHKYLTLGQAMATLFILCTSLYLVSTTPINSKQFYAELVYMAAMGFQLVLYCLFGNEITLKAKEIPTSVWHCDWLESDLEFKKSMIFTMNRMQKPVFMTVGQFFPLTLETFVAILKASYSFFAVIKKTNNN